MLDRALYISVGRHGFGSVILEIRMIEGRIINVLLYISGLVSGELTVANVCDIG